MRRALLGVALVAATACSPATEVVLSVGAGDLVAGTDVKRLRITVTNPSLGGAVAYQSPDLVLCAPGASGGCTQLPVTVTLVPGAKRPDESVRVELDAFVDGATPVASDASVFRFVPGVSQRLELSLHRSCLGALCAASDQACDASGRCATIVPAGSAVDGGLDGATPALPTLVEYHGGEIAFQAPVTLTPPQHAVAGDLVLVGYGHGAQGDAVLTPAGWSTLTTRNLPDGWEAAYLFQRTAADGEASATATYTFDYNGNSNGQWELLVFRGVSDVALLHDANVPQASDGSVTVPSLEATEAPALLVDLLFGPSLTSCTLGSMDVDGAPWEAILQPLSSTGATGARALSCNPPSSTPAYVGYFQLLLR